MLKPKVKDLIDKRFGYVTILTIFMKPGSRRRFCKYKCICGKESQIRVSDILSGRKVSCGCLSGLPSGESTIRSVISDYKSNANKKNMCFNLTDGQTRGLLLSNCYYCGIKPNRIAFKKGLKGTATVSGIDRKDNKIGYTENNCVTCCKKCNYKKGSSSTRDFLKWIKEIYENLSLDLD